MARPIDEKIVAMKMDNSDFVRKASETTSIFGKMTSALDRIPGINLGRISESLGGIQKAAGQTDLSALANSVDTIAGKFSNLSVVATTALATVTNRAVDAGLNLAKNLGVGQIGSGFQEYELKMGSIGTVLANTQWDGTTLTDVNKALGALNEYSDETIYNFAQMTQNVGRFTAAGVTLGDSTTAIKGLGNLAAISGSSSDQLNTAMYQMSQALAAGKLNLMDWNSMTNAGMGGKKTQDALVATAKKMGKNIDMSEGFRNSIEQGWLTSDVFLQTLKQFGDDESMTDAATKVRTFSQMMDTMKEGIGSGWATSWEIIFGDFEEATKLWTGVSDFFGGFFEKQADQRNAMLRAIFDGGALASAVGAIKNVLQPFGQIFGAIGDGFRAAFPPIGSLGILSILSAIKDFTSNLKLSEGVVNSVKTIFTGFFSIFAIGWKVIKGAVSVVLELLPSFSGLGAKILELIAKVAQIPTAFNNASTSASAFDSVMSILKVAAGAIATTLIFIVDALLTFADAVRMAWYIFAEADYTGGPWDEDSYIVDKLFDIREAVVATVEKIQEAWTILTSGKLSKGGPWDGDSKIVDWLLAIRDAFKTITEYLSGLEFSMEPIANTFQRFFENLKTGFDWIVEKLSGVGDAIKNALPSGNQVFAGGFIAALLGIVAMSLKMAWQLYDVFTSWGQIGAGVAEVLEGVGGALEAFSLQVKAQALLTIAVAVGILAVALMLLSTLKASQIAKGLYAIIGSLSALVIAMAIMTKYDITGTGMMAAVQIVAMSIAFTILAGAIKRLSGLSWGEMTKGLVGLIGVMGVFSVAIAVMSRFGSARIGATALQFLALAAAMHILVSVVKKIAEIDTKSLVKGMITLGIILGQLAIFLKISSGSSFSIGATIGMLAIGQAIENIVSAVKVIADIDTAVLVKGLVTITLILAQIAIFARVTSGAGLLTSSIGMLLIAGALLALTIPLKILGGMDYQTLAVGLGAIAIALVAIGAASKLMTGMIAAGIGIALIAGALTLLMLPIKALSAMSWENLVKGLVGLGAVLLIVGGAALLLAPAVIPMIGLGVAIGLLGLAMLGAGLGMSLFATGLVTLAAMTGSAVVTIVAMLGTLIMGLISLIPMAIDFISELIMQMATTFTTMAPILYGMILDMGLGMLNAFSSRIPEFAAVAASLIAGFLNGISQQQVQIVESAVAIITNFLDALALEIPKIMDSATNLIVALADSVTRNAPIVQNAFLTMMAEVTVIMVSAGVAVIDALFGWIPGVSAITQTIGNTAEENIRSAFDAQTVAVEKGSDFAGSLEGTTGQAKSAGASVGSGAEQGADSADLNTIGGNHGDDFASSLASRASAAKASGDSVANSAEAGADTADLRTIGGSHGTEFASGISSRIDNASSSGRSIATGAKTGASEISMVTTGTNFGSGFASGINSTSVFNSVVAAGKSIASAAKSAVAGWLDIRSPSRVMMKDGGHFGTGFAIGIGEKAKLVASNAKGLAMTAKDSLNKFLDGFEIPEDDNELHFKAVIDYEALDLNRFGNLRTPIKIPDLSMANSLAASSMPASYRQEQVEKVSKSKENEVQPETDKKAAIIQIVTPDKRELARFVVDDVTDFQQLKIATDSLF